MKKWFLIFFVFSALFATAQKLTAIRPIKGMVRLLEKDLADAATQYAVLAKARPADKFPKTFFPSTGAYEFSNSGWWCSGFYPATLLALYQETSTGELGTEALRMLELLKKEQYNTGTHDLGFMMYCPFSAAKKVFPAEKSYDSILMNSARSLATRFDPKVGCIKSWNSKEGDFLVIIDNMMNLELLFWATKYSGDSSFYKVAVTHANTTLLNHFRPDHSSYHVVNYNRETGAVQKKQTAQGAADSSAWARGQAWGLYGYTMAYRETKDPRYLQQAKDIAAFILHHPRLPADNIPYWDFDAPGIPDALRDASAAAIISSALLELLEYTDAATAQQYFKHAEKILQVLSTPAYKAAPGKNGGFILMHGVGHNPNKTEVDVPLTYADYYFVEAIERYLSVTSK